MNLAGAYWRGVVKRIRCYKGFTALPLQKSQLDEYLAKLEEAKKRS